MKFTTDQKRAIEHPPENLQLIACAGSGKTEVVARRICRLLDPRYEPLLKPSQIIAFTFTEKAAGELKDRIITRCREELGDITGIAEMFVGTIHAFCLDLLKAETPKYLKYEVLNEVQQILFVDRHSKQSGLTTSTDIAGRQLTRYKDTPNYVTALSILREADIDEAALAGLSLLDGLDSYRDLLDDRSHFDYSAILEAAVEVLTNDEALRKRIADRVRYVVVDEYQDVNPIQEAMVWLLHDLGAKVCVVGDDDQTIYQWRGSDVQNILSFATRYPKVETVRLEDNFRSSDGVVETARPFIEQNVDRLPKAMKPTAAQDYEAGDLVALSFQDPDEEAAYIAQTIQQLRGIAVKEDDSERGISWSDMAILLRTVRASGEPITQALDSAGIPYVVTGMNNLFSSDEAEAARQLFYFMAGRTDETGLENAWRNANTGSAPATLKKAIRNAANARDDMQTAQEKRFNIYSIQRQFLTFLEDAEIREELVPNGRGEVLFYNLGKFSQLISDFETIHYRSEPQQKYSSFADFLQFRAESYYPEGWQDNHYANPDAVRVMTVHQAKGMQWPVVFVPALLRNRFPSKKQGGRSVWHLLPRAGVVGQPRFEGTIEDERRLFYVAMTRSQKFLFLTWAPVPGNKLFQQRSEFWDDILASKYVKRRQVDYSKRKRATPSPKASIANVVLSFSDLKYFFECPYQFKLRILYGFNAPIHEALGYGKSLHDVLAEVHSRAIRGDIAKDSEVRALVDTHLHTPYAYPALREALRNSALKVVGDYLQDNRELFDKLEFSEKQIEISLGDGVSIVGRIDLVRRIDTDETTIVDLKSNDRSQEEIVTETQLHIYALGYEQLTGRSADYVEIYNLDERKKKPRSVDAEFIDDVKTDVRDAADALRNGMLVTAPAPSKCATCDYLGMCTAGANVAKKTKPTK